MFKAGYSLTIVTLFLKILIDGLVIRAPAF